MAQVSGPIKDERAVRAAEVAREMNENYLAACVGKVLPVLYEQARGEYYVGHAPNYVSVAVSGGEELHNRVLPTRITAVQDGVLMGEIIE